LHPILPKAGKYLLGYTAVGCSIAIGDALLVRAVPDLFSAMHSPVACNIGVSLLHYLRGILVGDNPADDHHSVHVRYVLAVGSLHVTPQADLSVQNLNT
jgi:hypothetical protein